MGNPHLDGKEGVDEPYYARGGKKAGVSPATVSRVLNKTRYISPETEHGVLEVVRQLNYYKNIHARRLSTGQSNLFGLVASEIANPYFPEIIRGFQGAAWDRGFDILLLIRSTARFVPNP
ncbi:MAG TPA: LacI family DNA-binding transcriptional regulator [Candidatus Sulfotelmatobacter sp.]